MNKVHVFVLLIASSSFKGQQMTTGNHFHKIKGDDERDANPEQITIKPSFFGCDRSTKCSYIGKKEGKLTALSGERDAVMFREYDELWESSYRFQGTVPHLII